MLSERLKKIADKVLENTCSVADIGTDHAYIPIYLIKEGRCKKTIASDVNKGPLDIAFTNIKKEGLEEKVELRLGSGLNTINIGEVECAIIAGMGGILIKEIMEENLEKVKKLKYLILQPVQNIEILRKYIMKKKLYIYDEEIVEDNGKIYQIICAKKKNGLNMDYPEHIIKMVENLEYRIGPKSIEKKDKMLITLLNIYIERYNSICNNIAKDGSEASKETLDYYKKIIEYLKEVKEYVN